MFQLKLYDRLGNELNEGDIVKVSNGRSFSFYSEVKYLQGEEAIAPFHTFSFHSFEKVDKVPDDAVKANEERYSIWYLPSEETDELAEDAEQYLIDWRQCEHLLDKKVYRITKTNV